MNAAVTVADAAEAMADAAETKNAEHQQKTPAREILKSFRAGVDFYNQT